MPLHHLTRFPRLELIGARPRSNTCRDCLIILAVRFTLSAMTLRPLQWAAINCVSWSFWWPTRCEKGRIR